MASRILRAARPKPTLTSPPPVPPVPATPVAVVKTAAKRRTPGQPVDLKQLRERISAASGGSVPLVPTYSNVAVVERYAGKVKNRTTAIRAKCIDCSAGMPSEVAACEVRHCALHPVRMGDDPFRAARRDGEPMPVVIPIWPDAVIGRYYARIKNRGSAIRAKCMECMNGQPSLVASCEATSYALHGFRMGGDPKRAERAAARAAELAAQGIVDDGSEEADEPDDTEEPCDA